MLYECERLFPSTSQKKLSTGLIPLGLILCVLGEVLEENRETEHRDINKQLFHRKQSQVKASKC